MAGSRGPSGASFFAQCSAFLCYLHSQTAILHVVSRHLLNSCTFILGSQECQRKYLTFPLSSVTRSCPTLCDFMDCRTPGFPVHHQLPEPTQTHVHCVGDAIQLRESTTRHVDKKSGVPEEEKGVWDSQGRGKDKHLFFSTFLSLSHIIFFSLSLELMITQQTTQFKLCTKDYITTMYPA